MRTGYYQVKFYINAIEYSFLSHISLTIEQTFIEILLIVEKLNELKIINSEEEAGVIKYIGEMFVKEINKFYMNNDLTTDLAKLKLKQEQQELDLIFKEKNYLNDFSCIEQSATS